MLNANAFERLAQGACFRLVHARQTLHIFSRAWHTVDIFLALGR